MNIIILGLVIVAVLQLSYIIYKQPKRVTKLSSNRPLFVDTSALIDGRIIALGESGFVSDTLMVPRSVIGELQLLADGSDHDKRSRARYGLDVVKLLQEMKTVTVEIFPDDRKVPEGVDNRLLALAKDYSGAICTVDFNLNKVAQLEEIQVLNVNELAQALRMAYLPGEITRIALTQKGQDSGQAVGYLGDGTMVVVDGADKKIGKTVDVEFIRSFQTVAGRMMFAKLIAEPSASKPKSLVSKLSGRKPVAQPKPKPQPAKQPDQTKSSSESSDKPTRRNNNSGNRNQSRDKQTTPKGESAQNSQSTNKTSAPRRRKSMREQREDS
ncbi:MAG: TRAM domain-containing protein, partial [bacterium]|nr:TRAM domain-containing protein [bacterium]